jgi:hypothetical protein
VEIAIKLSKRQEFLRFPITRCNLLHPWLLCSSRFRLLTAVVGILYVFHARAGISRHMHHDVTCHYIDTWNIYLIVLYLGTGVAFAGAR